MSIVYWCLHIWGDSIQAACSGNGQANFDKEFETMIDNGRETLHEPRFCAVVFLVTKVGSNSANHRGSSIWLFRDSE